MTVSALWIDPGSLVARIVAELQANPDAQAMLLHALLTGEFLGIPTRLKRIELDIVRMKADIENLQSDVAELKSDVAELKSDVAELKSDVAILKFDVAVLKGDSLEVKLHRRVRSLLGQRLGLRRARIMQSPVQETSAELFDPVEKALDDGTIDDGQESRIDATDIVVRARHKGDPAPVWVAVEVSNHINRQDIERAHRTGIALHSVFCQETIAAVAGYRIHPRDRERANEAGVHVLLVEEIPWAADSHPPAESARA